MKRGLRFLCTGMSQGGDGDELNTAMGLGDDFAERIDGGDVIPTFSRGTYLPFEALSTWTHETKTRLNGGVTDPAISMHKTTRCMFNSTESESRYEDPFFNPHMESPFKLYHNERQRGVLTKSVLALKELYTWQQRTRVEHHLPKPLFRALCCGVAGTGKTFIMKYIRLFNNLVMNDNRSTEVLAPTGGAAGNCGGRTMDSALSVSRSARSYESLGKNVSKLGELQAEWSPVECS